MQEVEGDTATANNGSNAVDNVNPDISMMSLEDDYIEPSMIAQTLTSVNSDPTEVEAYAASSSAQSIEGSTTTLSTNQNSTISNDNTVIASESEAIATNTASTPTNPNAGISVASLDDDYGISTASLDYGIETCSVGYHANDIEDWGSPTSETNFYFNAGETRTVTIDGQTYTIRNLSSSSNTIGCYKQSEETIFLRMSNFEITAADGQEDRLVFDGSNNIINTGDKNDYVYTYSSSNTINLGAGNDSFVEDYSGANVVDGAHGTDYYAGRYSTSSSSSQTNIESYVEFWDNSIGNKTLAAGESKTVMINGSVYTVENLDKNNSQTIYYTTTGLGSTDMTMSNIKITAVDGQVDNLNINGSNNIINTGDENDNITIKSGSVNNTVNLGSGANTLIDNGTGTTELTGDTSSGGTTVEDWGTSGTETLAAGETKTVMINGLTYTLENVSSKSQNVTYSTNASTGEITLNMSSIALTAADGQEDKLIIKSGYFGYNTINTGDMDDSVNISYGSYNTINAGSGDDTLTINDQRNNIYGGDGNDNIVLNNGANKVFGEDGNDTVTINSDVSSNTIYGGLGENTLINNSTKTNYTAGFSGSAPTEVDFGTDGSYTLAAGQSVIATINGKEYLLENSSTNSQTITYSTNTTTDEITLTMSSIALTAADGQEDKLIITGNRNNAGGNIINTGDENDTIKLSANYVSTTTINSGDGDDTIIVNNAYSTTINAGNGNDNITINDGGISYINAGAGDDTITNSGYTPTINGGGGNDTLTNTNNHQNVFSNIESINGSSRFDESGDWGTEGTVYLNAGQTVTATINGKTYELKNTSNEYMTQIKYSTTPETGEITLNMSSVALTAVDGQTDNLIITGNCNTINTGDMDDIITNTSYYSTINTGDGADTIINNGSSVHINSGAGNDTITTTNSSTINAGAGDDTIVNNGYDTTVDGGDGVDILTNQYFTTSTNIENLATSGNWGTEGSVNLAAGETVTATINGMTYTITNTDATYTTSIIYSTDEDGTIRLEGQNLEITAAEGQADKLIIKGNYNTINTGDMDDSIINEEHNDITINAGDGNDTIIVGSHATIDAGAGNNRVVVNGEVISEGVTTEDWGTEGTQTLAAGETKTVMINGMVYTLENTSTTSSQGITYSTDADGTITFDMNYINLTAAEGQEDKLIVAGSGNIINTGDMDDNITIGASNNASDNNTVNAGDGDDIIIGFSSGGTISGGAGNDAITLFLNGNKVYGNDGDDTITLTGTNSSEWKNIVDGGNGTDTIITTSAASDNYTNTENTIELWGTSGTQTLAYGETKTVMINGMVYTLENTNTSSQSITYSTGTDGNITLDMDNVTLTATDGQEDKLVINGTGNTVLTGDMDDSITIKGNNNTIDGGDGTDKTINTGTNTTISNAETIITAEDWGTEGTKTLAKGETKTVMINGNVYTLTNKYQYSSKSVTYSTDADGFITLTMSSIALTAADGQEDKLIIKSSSTYGNNTINTGDMDDNVIIQSGTTNTVDTGAGNDNITINSNSNTVYGKEGDDSVTINDGASSNKVYGGWGTNSLTNNSTGTNQTSTFSDTTEVDWGTSSSAYTLAAGGSVIATINGKQYLLENLGTSSQTIYYATNTSTDEVTLKMSSIALTAADGQTDKLIIKSSGTYGTNTINTGDMDDNITIQSSCNTVNAGDGDDIITVNANSVNVDGGNGTDKVFDNYAMSTNIKNIENGETIELKYGETKTINIAGKTYTLTKYKDYYNTSVTYTVADDGTVTFDGEYITVTAAAGQEDKVAIGHREIILDTGDMDDSIKVLSGWSHVVNAGSGNDDITIQGGWDATVNGGDGYDTVTDKNNITETTSGVEAINGITNIDFSGDWGTSGTAIINKGQTVTAQINGKTYELTNTHSEDMQKITYSTDANGVITFNMSYISVKAADGQTDDIIISGGNNNIDTGDMDDNITIKSGWSNSVNGGTGTDNLTTNSVSSMSSVTNTESINGNTNIDFSGDWGTSGTAFINKGQTVTATINGKTYEFTNNSYQLGSITYSTNENGEIMLSMSSIAVNAIDGQEDKLIISGSGNTVNTGDMNDDITIQSGSTNTILAGDGDDNVIINSGVSNNTVYGGWGTNSLTNNSSYSNNVAGFTTPTEENLDTADGTYTLAGGASIIATINGKEYLFENASTTSRTITYSTNAETGEITLNMSSISVTAADGQVDKLIVNGAYNIINTGDLDDEITLMSSSNGIINAGSGNDRISVTSGYSNIVNGGDGTNYVINNGYSTTISNATTVTEFPTQPTTEDWGTSGTKTLAAGETKTVMINGMTYTLTSNNGNDRTITYSTDADGYITFEMDGVTITAADGQADKIKIVGYHNNIYTGDMDDELHHSGGSVGVIDTGDGNDKITIVGEHGGSGSVNTGAGDDLIILEDAGASFDGGDGTDTVIKDSTSYGNFTNVEVVNGVELWGTEGTQTLAAGETKTVMINGMTYTLTNQISDSTQSITYVTDENGEIMLSMSSVSLTAADGQADNLIINGKGNIINTGDGNDNIILQSGNNNTIDGGDGTDTIVDNGTNTTKSNIETITGSTAGSFELSSVGATQTVIIDGKTYIFTRVHNEDTGNTPIQYSLDTTTGEITFTMSSVSVTAADGQVDNLIINGFGNTILTGDMDDKVVVNSAGYYCSGKVDTGSGTDEVIFTETNATPLHNAEKGSICLDKGDTKTLIIDGKTYTVKNNSTGDNTLNFELNQSTGEITFTGDNFEITAADGQEDNVVLNGSNLTMNTGDGDDTITNASGSTNNTINGGEGTNTLIDNGTNTTATGFGPQDWGTAGTQTLAAGETKTVLVNGLTYTLENTSSSNQSITFSTAADGNITFDMDYIKLTADAGQTDKLSISGANNIINTEDQNDEITVIDGAQNTVNSGDGNDTVTNSGTSTRIDDTENIVWGASGSQILNSNETVTGTINGKTYTITNTNSSSAEVAYTLNQTTGEVTFEGNYLEITAAEGQEDNLIIDGVYNTVNTGNLADNVLILGNHNILDTGAGDDNVTLANGLLNNQVTMGTGYDNINAGLYLSAGDPLPTDAESGSLIFGIHSQDITIAGKTYTLQNNGAMGNVLEFELNQSTGEITFTGDNFTITAADGQEDNIIIKGQNNEIFAGDMNDKVTVGTTSDSSTVTANNTIHGGAGNDTITMHSSGGVIYGDAGNDIIKATGTNSVTIDGGAGNDTLTTTLDFSASNIETINMSSLANANIAVSGNSDVTLNIDSKTYTAENLTNSANTITVERDYNFTMDNIDLTTATGQVDTITVTGSNNVIDTGDLGDTVTLADSTNTTLNAGKGNNTITITGGSDNTVTAGSGIDKITLNNTESNNINAGDGNNVISITGGQSNTITAGSGADKITLTNTNNNNITAGSGDDTVTLNGTAQNNTIQGGAGTDHLIDNLTGTNENNTTSFEKGTVNLYDTEKKIQIDDKQYIVESSTETNNTLTYEIQNGQITFDGDDVVISAAKDQVDNIILEGANNQVNTGSMDDKVVINGTNNTVDAGAGADSLIVNGANNTVYGNDGNDTLSAYGNNNFLYGGDSSDADSGNNIIYLAGDNNEGYGANGNDKFTLTGKNNFASGGSSGFDIITNSGNNNKYTQMNELHNVENSFKLQITDNYTDDSQYNMKIGAILPDINIDVTSYEASLNALNAVDKAMLDITSFRVDLEFQSSILETRMNHTLTKISNLNNSVSTIRDADTAAEYNNLLAKAALIDSIQLLQAQLYSSNQSSTLAQLINNLSG